MSSIPMLLNACGGGEEATTPDQAQDETLSSETPFAFVEGRDKIVRQGQHPLKLGRVIVLPQNNWPQRFSTFLRQHPLRSISLHKEFRNANEAGLFQCKRKLCKTAVVLHGLDEFIFVVVVKLFGNI